MKKIRSQDLSRQEKESMHPKEFREMVRQGKWDPDATTTEYYCSGYVQANLAVIPRDMALEFYNFCLRNPRNCQLIDVCDAGSPHPPLLAPDGDVRTDCQKYRVFKNGELIDEPSDILKYWREDMVAFLMSCAMGFMGLLREKHINHRLMGAYTSDIPCIPSGQFRCDQSVVSCRMFPTSLDAVRATELTYHLPVAHGYPIHIGDPKEIGVDLMHPDILNPYAPGQPPPPQPGEVCMTWGCGVTPQYAIRAAKPSLAMTHYAGMMFICDKRTEEYYSSFTT
jgi:uncharacterized protein YcsI (UPF0317 family)